MVLFTLISLNAWAEVSPLQLQADQASQSLNGHMEVIFDTSSSMNIEEVKQSQDWEAVGDQPYTKGLEEGAVWLHFRLQNPTDAPIRRAIHIPHGLADTATAWIEDEDGQVQQFEAGEDTPLKDRIFSHFHPRYPIELEPGEELDVVLRMTDEGTMSAPVDFSCCDS